MGGEPGGIAEPLVHCSAFLRADGELDGDGSDGSGEGHVLVFLNSPLPLCSLRLWHGGEGRLGRCKERGQRPWLLPCEGGELSPLRRPVDRAAHRPLSSARMLLTRACLRCAVAASTVVCADGGSNWVYDDLPALAVASGEHADEASAREALLPAYIIGDLDSVRPEVRAFYAARGVEVIDRSFDQDSTDFMKALDLLQGTLGPHGADGGSAMRGGALASTSTQIVAVCGSGADRPDHDLGNMSTLIERADRRIALVGKRCITRCLPVGHNSLRLVAAEGPECGLVPLCGPSAAHSSGLKWELDGQCMRMGGLISSCNQVTAREISVHVVDAPLMWTVCFDDAGIVPYETKVKYVRARTGGALEGADVEALDRRLRDM